MSPTEIASASALVATVLASLLPADASGDRSARSWVKRAWLIYRVKVAVLQIVATGVLSVGAQRIGWAPGDTEGAWTSILLGISWSGAAIAVLRAEVAGFNSSTATPGFSLLRSFSAQFTSTLTEATKSAVREKYRSKSLDEIQQAAYAVIAEIEAPQSGGLYTPEQNALVAAVKGYVSEADNARGTRLIAERVVKHNLDNTY